MVAAARRRTHSALGLTPRRRTPGWGLEKDAAGQGCYSAGNANAWKLLRGGNGEERSPVNGVCAVGASPEANRVRNGTTPVCQRWPTGAC